MKTFRIGDPIVVESQWSTRYYVVQGIIKTKGENNNSIEYVVAKNNNVSDTDQIRKPTFEELGKYY